MARFSLSRLFSPRAAQSVQAATTEIGYQNPALPGWGDYYDEFEQNPDLQWPLALKIYDRMRNEDPQVGSVLRAVTSPIQQSTWSIDPAGARAEVVELVADSLGLPIKGQEHDEPLRTRDRFSWDSHLQHVLLSLPHGHSFFEQVYRIEGDRAYIRKLAWRPPSTIETIKVARDGGLVGIRQYDVKDLIPVDRLVAYVPEREGANWRGRSILRLAYKMWLLKDSGLRVQAMTIERNGLGVPVYTGKEAPEQVEGEARTQWDKQERDSGLKLAKGLRAGETAGASIPGGAKLELLGVNGRLPDTDKPIRYYDEQIGRIALANFLNLGGDNSTGSYALGDTFEDFFIKSLNREAESIRNVTQQHVVEDLVDVNWGPQERAPKLTVARIGEDQAATAEALKLLVESGIVQPDERLESWARARYRMPVKDESTTRASSAPTKSTEEAA